jgi:bifunctional non-homologous end joining protein LigD
MAADLPDLSQYGRLAEYRRKRRFDVTPEPPPTLRRAAAAAGVKPLEFVVQKHRAGHLHYDVRLEHEGVMLSWAVPKGPSLDPGVKRLAMETEPHPMEYNQFEGVIPEGEYGGGTVMIWDRGTWWPEVDDVGRAYAQGRLKFTLEGKKLRGSWALVRTGGARQWLMIKHRDEHATGEDLTLTRPLSVVSRRTLAGIARAAGASARQLEQASAADPPRPAPAEGASPKAEVPTAAAPAPRTRASVPRASAPRPRVSAPRGRARALSVTSGRAPQGRGRVPKSGGRARQR